MQHKVRVFSRHPSHRVLRNTIKVPRPTVFRLGSPTRARRRKGQIIINTVESIEISANKKLMKEAFVKADVPTPEFVTVDSINELMEMIENEQITYPLVAKSFNGSRGIGNTKISNDEELKRWTSFSKRNPKNYIYEKYLSYLLEYRLHVTEDGCFYTCRKALKKGTPDDQKWRRHIDNSVWFLETNPEFKKPNSWDDIVADCVKALKQIGADVLSFDVRVQSDTTPKGKKREYQKYALIECNSASSMSSPDGNEISTCAQKYIEEIPKIVNRKIGRR